jgi:hypothetical protein
MMKTKHIAFDFKKTASDGTFEGLLSPYGNVDDGGDEVVAGAYEKNLREKGAQRPLLWQHMTDCPIGTLMLDDRTDGLYCKGSLLMSIPEAKRAYELLKAGIVTGLSIGYRATRDEIQGGVRLLKEIVLYEGSIVTFSMNELAQISSVKSIDHDRAQRAISEFKRDILSALKGNQ